VGARPLPQPRSQQQEDNQLRHLKVRLGIVTGLAAERSRLRSLPADQRSVRCFGMGPGAAAKAASELLQEGCTALLSFGLAGGLDPLLRPGSVVVAEAIVTDRGELLWTDTAWRQRVIQRLTMSSAVVEARIAGSDRPLLTPSAKRAVAKAQSAVAVDTESQAVARAAQRSGVPFMAIRAVADPSERSAPAWLAKAIDGSGRPRLHVVAAGALANPLDLPQLFRLARDQRAALAALSRVVLDAGPLFALR
jgi:adenosylhomocysteine nucleosidase